MCLYHIIMSIDKLELFPYFHQFRLIITYTLISFFYSFRLIITYTFFYSLDYLLILCCYSQHPDYKQETVSLFLTSRIQTTNCVVIFNILTTNNKLCCYSQHPEYKQQTVLLFSTSQLQTTNCVVILNISTTNNKLCCYSQHPDYKQQTVLLFSQFVASVSSLHNSFHSLESIYFYV